MTYANLRAVAVSESCFWNGSDVCNWRIPVTGDGRAGYA